MRVQTERRADESENKARQTSKESAERHRYNLKQVIKLSAALTLATLMLFFWLVFGLLCCCRWLAITLMFLCRSVFEEANEMTLFLSSEQISRSAVLFTQEEDNLQWRYLSATNAVDAAGLSTVFPCNTFILVYVSWAQLIYLAVFSAAFRWKKLIKGFLIALFRALQNC